MPHRKLIARLQAVVGITQEDQDKLVRMPHTVKSLAHGEYVHRQGDMPSRCVVVIEGFLSRQRVVNARNQISSFYLPGDMPDLPTLHMPLLDHDLCSVGGSRVASVPHSYLREIMRGSHELTQAFWRETLVHAAIYREWVDNLGSRQALGRVAHLICEIAARLEFVGLAESGRCHLPLTQQNLADACGLSTVHVNRTIQELRREGLIEWQNHTMQILRWTELEDLAEFSADYLHALENPGTAPLPKRKEP